MKLLVKVGKLEVDRMEALLSLEILEVCTCRRSDDQSCPRGSPSLMRVKEVD